VTSLFGWSLRLDKRGGRGVGIELPHLQVIDFCALADPNPVAWVAPSPAFGVVATSGNGGYYYTTLCKAWVADIKMATYSNTQPVNGIPTNPNGDLIIGTTPYDLPSSQSFGGSIPTVEEDCGRLKWWARYYRKRHNEDHFTKIGDFKATTSWQPNVCQMTFDGGITAHRSEEGWDTYRVAVGVMLRTSAQEVAVQFLQAPPL
jgi:hypothetical protein